MFNLILCLLTLNYIPKEFDKLRKKAIKSSHLKPLANYIDEPIITPSKPFISGSFIGTVLHPIFGVTVKELKGWAVTKTKSHLAIIVDRNTESGKSMLQEKSVFFGENNLSISLSNKFADDGEVVIFNVTEIDPLSAFHNFDFSLSSSLDGKCGKFGKQFGARCSITENANWDPIKKLPKEVDMSGFNLPEDIAKNFKFYAGIDANAQASVMLKRRGASAQAEFDASLDIIAGAGFHANAVNSSSSIDPKQDYRIGNSLNKELGRGSVTIFLFVIELKATLFSKILVRDVSFKIPHDIDVMRTLSIHLKKHYIITNKHSKTTDNEKDVKLGKVHTEVVENGYNPEVDIIEAEFNSTFAVRAGIRIDLVINNLAKFSINAGPEVGLALTLGVNSEKCTFPAFYGAFTPFINTFVDFSGKLVLGGVKLFQFKKGMTFTIYKKEIFNDCFFDSASSRELEKELLEISPRKRSIIQVISPIVHEPKVFEDPDFIPIVFVGENEMADTCSIIGPSFLYPDKISVSKNNDYLFVGEYSNFSQICSAFVGIDGQIYNETIKYPFDSINIDTKPLSYTVVRNESQPILLGNQFNFSNIDEIKNFKNRFMSQYDNTQPISLILHTKENGYFSDPTKYFIVDEIYDTFVNEVNRWFRIEIKKLTKKTISETTLLINRFTDDKDYPLFNILQFVYLPTEDKKSMEPQCHNGYILIKKSRDLLQSKKLFQVMAISEKKIIGDVNITYKDITNTQFTKKIGDEIEITFEDDENYNDVEYVLQLEDSYKDEIRSVNELNLNGIVSRSFVAKNSDGTIQIFTGENVLSKTATMEENEMYGTFVFYFKNPGYQFENNNIFAFVKISDAVPLLKSAKVVSERENLFVIKLETKLNVNYDKDDNSFISIPFRRRIKAKGSASAFLYSIYQSNEKSEKDIESPYCDDFPEFRLQPKENFYCGCIRTYADIDDYNNNLWKHYPSTANVKDADYPDEVFPIKDTPFCRLHVVGYKSTTKSSEYVTVVAKQEYFHFPEASRSMIIDDSIVQKHKKYAPDVSFKVTCSRCKDIHRNSFLDPDSKMHHEQKGNFAMSLDDIDSGFVLDAVCLSEEDTNCVFEYNVKNEGITILEFNTDKNLEELSEKNLLEEKGNPTTYPGVEEIYEIEKDVDPLAKSRININCNRQIIPERSDVFYLNKPWKGKIKKISNHLENEITQIEVIQTTKKDVVEIKLIGKGFAAKNADISDEQQIPFNPKFYTEDEVTFKNLLKQIGIEITKNKDKTAEDDDVVVNNYGTIIVKKNLFKGENLEQSVKDNQIDLIDIPLGKYTLSIKKVEEKDDGNEKDDDKKKNKLITIPEAGPKSMGDFDINVVYVGGSELKLPFITRIMKNILVRFIPSNYFYHSAIWVGQSDANDESIGAIFVYGGYRSLGNNPTFIFGDGARSYLMSLKRFKQLFGAYEPQKLIPQRKMTIFNLLDEIKNNENNKWRAKDFKWIKNNCQTFASHCLSILQPIRSNQNINDFKILPNKIMKTILLNEENSTYAIKV